MKQEGKKIKRKIHVFEVSLITQLDRVGENPYRVIAVPSEYSLYDLAEVIVGAFDFYCDHCFGFYDNFEIPHQSVEGYELFKDLEEEGLEPSEYESVKENLVGKVFPVGGKMLFLFDYGDNWWFKVETKEIKTREGKTRYPRILESVGEPPVQYPPADDF